MAGLPNAQNSAGLAGLAGVAANPVPKGVYWVGADGNYYVKGADGTGNVVNYGKSLVPLSTNTIKSLTQIQDPNPPAGPASTSGTTTPDNSVDIGLQLGTLANEGAAYKGAVDKVNSSLAGINAGYATDDTNAAASYGTNTTQNKSNLSKNQQTALVNAAQGRQGLFGVLGSLGALSGSGIELANNAVQKGANEDLEGADDNFATNQQGLDSAYGTFKAEDAKRKTDAQTEADSAITQAKNQSDSDTIQAYKSLANDYQGEGDATDAAKYTSLIQALLPDLAATNGPASTPTAENLTFTAPSLNSYLNGGTSAVSTTPANTPGGIPGLVANPVKKKATVAV